MIKFLLISLNKGSCLSPYISRKRGAFDFLTQPLASIGSSVINSIAGGLSNSSANKTNLEIARQNNEQQYKMFKEQQAFDLDMWNKTNEYNAPKAVVERLLSAGINPSSVFGSGSATPAGQLTSPQSPNLQQAHVNPYQPNIDVGSAVNAKMQSDLINAQRGKLDAETKHTEALTMFEQRSMEDRLRSLQAIARRDDAMGDIAKSELRYLQDSYYWRLKSLRNDIVSQEDQHRLTQEQIYNHKLQNGLAEIQLVYAPRMNEANLKQYYATINQLKAQVGLILANKTLTEKQVESEIQKKVGMIIDNGMKGLSFDVQKAVKDWTISSAREEYIRLYNSNRFSDIGPIRFDRRSGWWNSSSPLY